MKFDPHKPYNQLPLLPPRKDLETKAILKKAIATGRALAELKGIGSTIPNQTILINTIALQEAKSSSEIENIVTTNDALFKAFSARSSHVDAATKEVLRYREALWEGFNTFKKRPVITTNLLVKLVQTIKENQAGIRNAPGTAVANASTGEVLYTPPEGESIIRDKLKNLEDYIHGEDSTDPLVKLAVMHYQFEAIHPFFDGNGRTGRILCILFLIHRELLELPISLLIRMMIPTKPTINPSTLGVVILSSCNRKCAIRMVNNGTVASRMDATAESIESSPHEMRKNGIATLVSPTTQSGNHSLNVRGN